MHSGKIKSLALTLILLLAPGTLAGAQDQDTPAPQQVQETKKLNMERAVLTALRDNPGIHAAKAGDMAAKETRKAALGGFGPSLSGTYGYRKADHDKPHRDAVAYKDELYTATLSVQQPLFTGFALLSTYQNAVIQKEQAAAQVNSAELRLTLLVQENFLRLLAAREGHRSAKDQLERLQSQLKVAQAFYKVGLSPRIDVLQAERDLSDAEDKLLQAENTVLTQETRLNTLLGLPLDATPPYVGSLDFIPFSLSLEECLRRAYGQRPDIRIAQHAVAVAGKERTLAQSGFYPQLNAGLDYSRSGENAMVNGGDLMSTEFSEWSAGVSMSWNLFNSGRDYYTQSAAAHQIRKMLAEEANLRQEIGFEVQSRRLKLSETTKRIRVAQKTVEQATEAYRMAVARYQAQVGTNTDVLDAQAALTNAEAALTNAQADYLMALANLYVSIGEKNPSLHMPS